MKMIKFLLPLMAVASLFVGCDNGSNDVKPTGNIELTADNTTITVGESITFTVVCEGIDVTADAKIFMRSEELPEVSNPYTPESDGTFEFYAVYGSAVSARIAITVDAKIPELPADGSPSNTDFNHRILLVDHTGTQCSFCPEMMEALKEVSETGDYHSKYYEAMSHTYNSNDPAWSKAADAVTGHYNTGGSYPALTFNFRHNHVARQDATDIMQQIDALWCAEGADAGIAAACGLASNKAIVNVEVKAAKAGEYNITAWLLEDGIYGLQGGAKEEWMNTHNNAIRQIASSEDISGISLGTIAAGERASTVIELPILSQKWARENLKVMLIVSTPNAKGKYEVANVAICPANNVVTYDYKTDAL